jgi:hypothetical protein
VGTDSTEEREEHGGILGGVMNRELLVKSRGGLTQ